MKRRLASVFLLLLLPANALALTADQRKTVRYGAPYYNAQSNCVAGGPGGSGPLFGLHFPKVSDTKDLSSRIDTFINQQEPQSPMKVVPQLGALFVQLGQKYDVNPAYMVGDGLAESSLGMGDFGEPQYHDPFNQLHSLGHPYIFPDYPTAMDAYYKQISDSLNPPQSIQTVLEETGLTVNGDKTKPSPSKAAIINDAMKKMLGGIVVDANSPAVAPVSSCGNITTSAGALGWDISGAHAMVTYLQADPKWGSKPYGAGKTSIAESGCGPTSIAMALATLLGRTDITPLSIANQYGAQYHTDGTAWSIFPQVAKDYHMNIQQSQPDFARAAETLKAGGLVVASFDTGYFTSQGHFMVIRAVSPDGTQFYIADPAHAQHNEVAYSIQFLQGQGNMVQMWTFNKP